MKKITPKKLSLKTESIVQLSGSQLRQAVGGADTALDTNCQCANTYGANCPTVGYTNCLCTYGYPGCNRH